MMNRTAIVIDGGYLAKIFKNKNGRNLEVSDVIQISHRVLKTEKESLFRIYYYNARPFSGEIKHPITEKILDYSKSATFNMMEKFHRELSEQNYIALRLGHTSKSGWNLPFSVIRGIKRGAIKGIKPSSLKPNFKQKAVDLKIGLDLALLASKSIVDRIVLVGADNDFIPAMKYARSEGVQVVLAKIEEEVTTRMLSHSDEVREVDITIPGPSQHQHQNQTSERNKPVPI